MSDVFSARLKELREKSGCSQQELANALGLSQSTVGNWEAGSRKPSQATVLRLAKHFHVSTDYLLGHSDVLSPTGSFPGAAPALSRSTVPADAASPTLFFALGDAFSILNEEGQKKLLDYANDLVASGRYAKEHVPSQNSIRRLAARNYQGIPIDMDSQTLSADDVVETRDVDF